MRIVEYKQTGTQSVTRTRYIQPVYDDNGELLTDGYFEEYVEEIPVYSTVYRDATPEEIAQTEQAEREAYYAQMSAPLDNNKKLELMLESIPVLTKPADRAGYLWKPIYNAEGNVFGWEEVVDPYYIPTADGSYLHPFTYTDGMTVEIGMWYTDGTDIWECIKTGAPTAFGDTEYFDVL